MPGRKILKFTRQILEVAILLSVGAFFLKESFFPSPSRNLADYIIANKNEIIFSGRLNLKASKILSLVGFDARNWCAGLGIWSPAAFQKTLDKYSLILSGAKLENVQKIIVEKKIKWWQKPFPGSIYIKCGRNKFTLFSPKANASLEKAVFLGLGIGGYLKFYRQSSQNLVVPQDFLKSCLSSFQKPSFKNSCRGKIKVIIEFNENP